MVVAQRALPLLRSSKHSMGPKLLVRSSAAGSTKRLDEHKEPHAFAEATAAAALNMAVKSLSIEAEGVAVLLTTSGEDVLAAPSDGASSLAVDDATQCMLKLL